jgi:hypothetical protein
MMENLHQIAFDPILKIPLLIGVIALLLAGLGFYIFKKGKAKIARGFLFTLLATLLLNPQIIKNQSFSLPNYVIVVSDNSPSMRAAKRVEGVKIAHNRLLQELEKIPNLKFIEASLNKSDGANLIRAIEQAKSNINPKQIAGAIIITDGLIKNPVRLSYDFPVHQLLIGTNDEKDIYLKITQNPVATEVGQIAHLKLKIIENGLELKTTDLVINIGNQTPQKIRAEVNKELDLKFQVTKRGKTPIAIAATPVNGEISNNNNYITTEIEGVRERLRVLLVSGDPYEGLRAWRNLLKSDPNVDLVHFTIMRSFDKDLNANDDELSLIPFPTYELFNERLNDFDLIVFDKFTKIEALPDEYLQNITDWVDNGGAFLMLAGSSEAENNGLLSTSLAKILPFSGNIKLADKEFKPQITAQGMINPITAPLKDTQNQWGNWTRIIEVTPKGNVLLSGDNSPLLITSYFGKGRVAAVLSDKSWLWQRGYEGGGPFRELFRNTTGWLLGEPALENNLLTMQSDFSQITTNLQSDKDDILYFEGGNQKQNITPNFDENRKFTISYSNLDDGLYKASYGDLSAFNIKGGGDEITENDLRVSRDFLNNQILKTASSAFFIGRDANGEMPKIALKPRNTIKFDGGLYLIDNKILSTNAIEKKPLINPIIMAFLIAFAALMMWWREGKNQPL